MFILLFLFLAGQCVQSNADGVGPVRIKYDTEAPTLGVIGQSAASVKEWKTFKYTPNKNGTCEWKGTCFFTPDCSEGFVSIRTFNGRCGTEMFADKCEPRGFGVACSNFFGVEKRYCCRQDKSDNTWDGLWRSSMTGSKIDCYYRNGDELSTIYKLFTSKGCGSLDCTRSDYVTITRVKSYPIHFEIGGANCTEVSNGTWSGIAESGLMTFFENKKQVDAWYKYPTTVDGVFFGKQTRDRH